MAITARMADGTDYTLSELLSKNLKTIKSDKADEGYETWGLAPAKLSGHMVCKSMSQGCGKACIFTAGHGTVPSVRIARVAKTRALFQHRAEFLAMLDGEITSKKRNAARKGLKLAVRLNVLSDLRWEGFADWLLAKHSDVVFYDYTKHVGRVTPANYHLTFSRSESNEAQALAEYAAGKNVAVVFRCKSAEGLPKTWNGIPVFSGDENDLRFMDPRGIVGLYMKGQGSKDETGFVVDVEGA